MDLHRSSLYITDGYDDLYGLDLVVRAGASTSSTAPTRFFARLHRSHRTGLLCDSGIRTSRLGRRSLASRYKSTDYAPTNRDASRSQSRVSIRPVATRSLLRCEDQTLVFLTNTFSCPLTIARLYQCRCSRLSSMDQTALRIKAFYGTSPMREDQSGCHQCLPRGASRKIRLQLRFDKILQILSIRFRTSPLDSYLQQIRANAQIDCHNSCHIHF